MEKYEKQKKVFEGLCDDEKVTLLNKYLESIDYTDSMVYSMDEIIRLAFYRGRFSFKQDKFNPKDEYFSFNCYGDLVSISRCDLDAYCDPYLDDMIDDGALEHLIEEEEEEEEEEDEEKEVL